MKPSRRTVGILGAVVLAGGALAGALGSCSLVLDFSGDAVDGGLPPDGPIPDADPFAPDAPPDPAGVLEPNDTLADAAQITPGTYGPMAIKPVGDHDFFKFDLAGPADVSIDCLFMTNQGDLDMRLYDPTGTKIAESAGFMDNEHIVRSTAMGGQIGPGTYTIEVLGFNNQRENDSYMLVLGVVEAPLSDAGPP